MTHVQPEEPVTIPAPRRRRAGRSRRRADRRARLLRRPLPDLARARRVGRDEPRPGLLGGLRGAAHRRRRASRGTRCASRSGAATTSWSPRSRRCGRTSSAGTSSDIIARPRRVQRRHDRRQPAALARPGEGRHAHGDRRRRQRRLGPGRQGGGQAGVAAARRHDAGADRRAGRLPLPGRRAHPDGGARHPARGAAGREERIAELERAGYPAYTTTPGWIGYSDEKLVRAVPAGGRRRVHPDQAQGRRRHRRRRPAHGPGQGGGRPGHPDRGRRQPALGRRRGRARRSPRSRPGTRTGSRSRPARTRSSAWPGSASAIAPGQDRGRRARRQPGDLQAAPAGGRGGRADHRRLPGGRGQREPGDPAARREVRRPRLPARGRRGPVRDGPAPGDVRLRRGRGHDGRPRPRVRRSPARALHRPGARHRRPVPGAVRARASPRRSGRSRCATTSSRTVPSGSSWPAPPPAT